MAMNTQELMQAHGNMALLVGSMTNNVPVTVRGNRFDKELGAYQDTLIDVVVGIALENPELSDAAYRITLKSYGDIFIDIAKLSVQPSMFEVRTR